MTMKKKGTDIMELNDSEIALSDARPDFMKANDRGNEDVSIDDLTIPRIDVIQDLSPQIKESKPEYIEGAKVGMLFNTVTNKLYPGGIIFVPVFFRKEWVVWKDIKAGGGFKGAFDSELEAEKFRRTLDDGSKCETVDTAQHYGIVINPDKTLEEVVISMSKSKMKVSRKLNSMVKLAGGDRFSRAYKIDSVEDQNSAGQDYRNLSFKQLGFVDEVTYHCAEKMYESVSAGLKNVSRDVSDEDDEDGDDAPY